ncbi:IS66-like element accessory protein TnpA [Porphyrobacter sp. MBR-155]|uniref:IS66-like element accessory protein TnpA n=1 Tax=Porphyrobacter sp. MBR-155 TaxID=3156464 RepID=UPI003394DE49
MTGRMEVIARVSGRRFWTVEQKLAVLRDAFGPGGSVRAAMDRHEVTSGLLYTWRRNAMAGLLIDRPSKAPTRLAEPVPPSFAQVVISDPVSSPLVSPSPPSPPSPSPPIRTSQAAGCIVIDLPTGVRLNVDATVDAEALARVLAVLER